MGGPPSSAPGRPATPVPGAYLAQLALGALHRVQGVPPDRRRASQPLDRAGVADIAGRRLATDLRDLLGRLVHARRLDRRGRRQRSEARAGRPGDPVRSAVGVSFGLRTGGGLLLEAVLPAGSFGSGSGSTERSSSGSDGTGRSGLGSGSADLSGCGSRSTGRWGSGSGGAGSAGPVRPAGSATCTSVATANPRGRRLPSGFILRRAPPPPTTARGAAAVFGQQFRHRALPGVVGLRSHRLHRASRQSKHPSPLGASCAGRSIPGVPLRAAPTRDGRSGRTTPRWLADPTRTGGDYCPP